MMPIDDISIIENSGLTRLILDLSGDFILSKSIAARINTADYLLPIDYIEKAGGYTMFFDAGTLISLSKFLRHSKTNKEMMIKILKNIAISIMSARESGLYIDNFSYSADHIFLDIVTLKTKLTLFPFETGQDAMNSFKQFLSTLLNESLTPDNDSDIEYITKITLCYKTAGFTVSALINLLNELELDNNAVTGKRIRPLQSLLGILINRCKPKHKPILTTCDNNSLPLPEPIVPSQKAGGTVLLIPDDKTEYIDQNKSTSINFSISLNGTVYQTEIKSFPCLLGRSSQDVNIVLDDKSISRKHALIDWIDDKYIVLDCGSSNGVTLNGNKLNSGEPRQIFSGDVITIGRAELRAEIR